MPSLVRTGGHSALPTFGKLDFRIPGKFLGKVAKFSEGSARDVFNHGIMREELE